MKKKVFLLLLLILGLVMVGALLLSKKPEVRTSKSQLPSAIHETKENSFPAGDANLKSNRPGAAESVTADAGGSTPSSSTARKAGTSDEQTSGFEDLTSLHSDSSHDTLPLTPIGRVLADATTVFGPIQTPEGSVRVVRSVGLKYPYLRILESDSVDGREKQTSVMVADHLLVKNETQSDERDFIARVQGMGYSVRKKMLAPKTYIISFEGEPETLASRFEKALNALTVLGRTEPDYLVEALSVPNDTHLNHLWGMNNLHAALITVGNKTYSGSSLMAYSPLLPATGLTAPLVDAKLGKAGDFPPSAAGSIVLIKRGEISYADKARNARAAGAVAVLIYHDSSNIPSMYGSLRDFGNWLPVLALNNQNGLALLPRVGESVTLSMASNGAHISALEAWDKQTGSTNILVGVIDTGIDYTHPDLAANIWVNPGESGLDANGKDKRTNGIDDDGNGFIDDVHGWDFANDDNDPMDDNRHGTHCAGTIAAEGNNSQGVVGVAWRARLAGIKFLSGIGSGYISDGVDAVYYSTLIGVHITSNSWGGGPKLQALIDAIEDANQHGILFVAAAGNSNNSDPAFPAGYPNENIISVAASDAWDNRAYFSNYGLPHTDLAAPGVFILSTVPAAIKSPPYDALSGTSMACPHVAGVAALLKSQAPGMTHLEIRERILETVDKIPSLTGLVATGGRLNANAALEGIPSSTKLELASFEVDDSTGGNGDGVANPGESIQFYFTFRNVGYESANNVSATLQSADPHVTISNSTTNFTQIPRRGQATASSPVVIQISPFAPTHHNFSGTLVLTDSQGRITNASFTLPISISYRVSGSVILDGQPKADALVEFSGPLSGTLTTGPGGNFEFFVCNGNFSLTAQVAGEPYSKTNALVFSTPGDVSGLVLSMQTATISGIVKDKLSGSPVPLAKVILKDVTEKTVFAGADGRFSLTRIYGRSQTFDIFAEKRPLYTFPTSTTQVTVPPDALGLNLQLGNPSVSTDVPFLEINLNPGEAARRVLTLSNFGGGDLAWSLTGIVNKFGTSGQLLKRFDFPESLYLYPEGVAYDGRYLYAYDGLNSPSSGALYKIDPEADPVANPTGVVQTLRVSDIIPGFNAYYSWLGCYDGQFLWFQVPVNLPNNINRKIITLVAVDPESGMIAKTLNIDPRLYIQTTGDWLYGGEANLEAFGENAFWFRTMQVDAEEAALKYYITKVDHNTGEVIAQFPVPAELVAPNDQNLRPSFSGLEYSGGALWLIQNHHANYPNSQIPVFRKIFKIDPKSGAVLDTINAPERGNVGIVADLKGALWIWSNYRELGSSVEEKCLSMIDSGERFWLFADKTIGKIAENGSSEIEINIDGTILGNGVHHGAIHISTNDPEKPVFILPVIVSVGSSLPGNEIPVISAATPPSPVEISETETSTFSISASDSDGDPLSYVWSLDGKTIPGVTGSSWQYQTSYKDAGIHGVAVSVTDGRGGVASHLWQVTVVNTNRPPIAQNASYSVANHESISIKLEASDEDGEPLTWTLLNSPASGTLNGTAPDLHYTPAPGYLGTVNFEFKVNDAKDDSNIATVTIFVGNRVAVVSGGPFNVSTSNGQTVTRTFTLKNDGSLPLLWTSPVASQNLPLNAGRIMTKVGPIPDFYSWVSMGLDFDGDHVLWGSMKLGTHNEWQYSGIARLNPNTGALVGNLFPTAVTRDEYFFKYHYIMKMAYQQGMIWAINTNSVSTGLGNQITQYRVDETANRLVTVKRLPFVRGELPQMPDGLALGMESLWVTGPQVPGLPDWCGIYRLELGTKTRIARFPGPPEYLIYGGPASYWNGALWLSNASSGKFYKVNPFNGQTLQEIPLVQNLSFEDLAADNEGGIFAKKGAYFYRVDTGEYVRMSPSSGSIAPGETKTITVTFDPMRCGVGIHQSEIYVLTNDPHNPSTTIPVIFEVTSSGIGNPPRIIGYDPASPVTTKARKHLKLTVAAEDLDNDPLTVYWTVNGAVQRLYNDKFTFDFIAPDTGGNSTIGVTVSDNNGNSVSHSWLVQSTQVPLTVEPLAQPESGPVPLNVAFKAYVDGGIGTDGPYCAEPGMVVIEAENYHRYKDYRSGRTSAYLLNSSAPSGDSVDGILYTWIMSSTYPPPVLQWSNTAEVEYDINFPTSGTYHLWMRVSSDNNNENSIWVGMDGTQVGGAFDDVDGEPKFEWRWVRHTETFNVTSGMHTLNLRAREHEYRVDRLLLTTDETFTPTEVGPRWKSPGLPKFNYSWSFGDGTPESSQMSPVHTYVAPGLYTASLTVTTADGQSATGNVTVRVQNTYSNWAATHLESLPENQRGPLDTPSGSKYPNLLRYALGITNLADSGQGVVETEITTGSDGKKYLSLRYRRDPLAADVDLRVEVSADLNDWDWNEGSDIVTLIEEILNNPNGTQTILERDTVPLDHAQRRFIRIKVSKRP